MVEQRPFKALIAGSSPAQSTIPFMSYEEYSKALHRIKDLLNQTEPGSKEEKELKDLVNRVEVYEERLYPLARVWSGI